jgi:hypothetical protein
MSRITSHRMDMYLTTQAILFILVPALYESYSCFGYLTVHYIIDLVNFTHLLIANFFSCD